MDILEDLWYGNIDPAGQPLRSDSPYRRALCRSVEVKENLCKDLDSEQVQLLETIADVEMEMQSIAQVEAFSRGFRLAIQLLWTGLKNE